MDCIFLTKNNEKEYVDYIETKDTCIYHTLEWQKIIQNTYSFEQNYLLFKVDEHIVCVLNLFKVKGLIKGKRLISIPFSHNVPILSNDEESKISSINMLKDKFKEFKYIEFKDLITCNNENIAIRNDNYNSIINNLNYESYETYFKSLSDSSKNCIRKSQKFIKIKTGNSLEMFNDFYKIIRQTRTRQGSPVYPKKLFSEIFHTMKEDVMIFSAFYEDKLCASIMVFYHKKKALYAYGGSFNNEEAMNKRPMNLLLSEAIKFSFEKNHDSFELGSTPKFNKGLLLFKKAFTHDINDISSTIINIRENLNIKRDGFLGKMTSFAIKNSPEFLNQMIGPFLLKEMA